MSACSFDLLFLRTQGRLRRQDVEACQGLCRVSWCVGRCFFGVRVFVLLLSDVEFLQVLEPHVHGLQ